MNAGPKTSFYKIESHSYLSTNNSVWLLRGTYFACEFDTTRNTDICVRNKFTKKRIPPLHSMLDEIENLACSRLRGMLSLPIGETSWKNKIHVKSLKNNQQWVSDLLLPGSPHPKRIASWSTYWSGSVLADGGKQAVSWKEPRESPWLWWRYHWPSRHQWMEVNFKNFRPVVATYT